ncbi:MAG: hypothetical protein KGZ97_11030 [Bacteroidetes bacterium]|nr:hypothetical protein [Bacteroidota bacterium]
MTLETSPISEATINSVANELKTKYDASLHYRIEKGVKATANLWRESDGSIEDFEVFCSENFIADDEELNYVFQAMAHNFEHLNGYMNRIVLELNRAVHEDTGPLHKIDRLFGAYSPSAHIQDDFYANKIAFIITLNFPYYSLEEKNKLGGNWDGRQWGFARLGEMFTARVPAQILQNYNEVYSASRLYISEYNIFAGKLLNDEGKTLFPENMKLLAHWNIRDEIKSNYGQNGGLEKQEMLYKVMLRIINQDIPKEVINNDEYLWNPFSNELFKDGSKIEFTKEGNIRYEYLLNNFKALKQMDPYYTDLDTYIKRRFDSSMEITIEEVEALFKEYAASPLLREVGKLISERMGRNLRPFDLWYDDFVGRGGMSEEALNLITKAKYPNATAMKKDLQRMLLHLGFDKQTATFIADRVDVDAARGSGHAWRASMRSMPSHLRTRIGTDGMDYKGYNIAVHEFGHNVEQTISMHMVDNYFITGTPNTAFTEALAFMFQRRDLDLLGFKEKDSTKENYEVIDIFWDNYEMMGVSLVDMKAWQWLYENPNATAEELKEAVISIAIEIWNDYYADVFGEKDIPLLAIYSHMIQSPLYLMNYPYGRLIMFQLEDYIKDKKFAEEVLRIFAIGRLTPQHWMQKAVGQQISNKPLFDAVEKALKEVK